MYARLVDDASRDPLRIDWLDPGWFADGHRGRLGVTHLPGKSGPSSLYPGRVYDRQLDPDLADLRAAGVQRLVLLIQDHELERWGSADIVERAAARGVEVIRRPIRDGGVPKSPEEMDEIVGLLTDVRGRGGDVAVACLGGVGRAGTVAACALIGQGLSAAQAIERVRQARHPLCVETRAQRDFVASYAHRERAA